MHSEKVFQAWGGMGGQALPVHLADQGMNLIKMPKGCRFGAVPLFIQPCLFAFFTAW